MSGFAIGETMATFLTSGNSIVVATRDAALRPHAVRACGIEVIAPDRIAVFVPKATGAVSVANLRAVGDVAVCVCAASDFRAVQLKGRHVRTVEAGAEDILASEQQLVAFSEAVARFGHTRAQVRNLWSFDTWRVEIQVTSGFGQTPGPGAGDRMESADDR